MNIIYTRINELCEEKNTKYSAVCKAVGLNASVIGNLKSRENSVPKADKISLIANYLGVSADYLLGITDEREPHPEDKKITATQGDGRLLDLSLLDGNQVALIEDVLKLNPLTLSVAKPVIESLLSRQQAQDDQQ